VNEPDKSILSHLFILFHYLKMDEVTYFEELKLFFDAMKFCPIHKKIHSGSCRELGSVDTRISHYRPNKQKRKNSAPTSAP
jgi:hypothetical protein